MVLKASVPRLCALVLTGKLVEVLHEARAWKAFGEEVPLTPPQLRKLNLHEYIAFLPVVDTGSCNENHYSAG